MALPTTEIKFDTTFIGRIPVLTGPKNYDIWSKQIVSTLSAYSVWEFVDGILTYTSLPVGGDLADRQQKWKLLDKHILGLMASTIDNSLCLMSSTTGQTPLTCTEKIPCKVRHYTLMSEFPKHPMIGIPQHNRDR
jgi:hypothetical protein